MVGSFGGRAWARALTACLLWFGLIGGVLGAMYFASIPDLPPIVQIEGAASHAPESAASAPSQDAPWKVYALPLRICQVRCDTPYTVYRHRFELAAVPDQDWALYLPFFDANIAVYLNGIKVDERGRMLAPVDVYRFQSRLVRLPAAQLLPGVNTLLLQLVSERRHIGGLSPFYVGPITQLSVPQRWRERLTADTVAGIGWLQAGSLLVALVIYLSRRRESVLGWYLMASMFWLSMIVLHASPTLWAAYGIRWTLMFISIFGILAFTPLFIVSILRTPSVLMRKGLLSYFALGTTLTLLAMHVLPLEPYWQISAPNWGLKLSTYILVPLMLWQVARIAATRSHSQLSSWILAFAAMPGVLGIVDAVRGTLAPPIEFALIPLGGLGVSLALWLELARRMFDNHRRMTHHTVELEQIVRARELALQQSFERIGAADRARALAEERQRLMRDMHDGVGGQLASLVHLADSPETSREQVVAGLREGLADLRLVLDSLALAEDDPLVALGRLRHRIEPTLEAAGMRLHWEIDPRLELPAWNPESVLHVYRLLQEATNNAIRHAHAQALTIRLRAADGNLEFSVIDDGVGMPPDGARSGGFGLASLRVRAHKLGGDLHIASAPGQGTCVRLTLPLTRAGSGGPVGREAVGVP